MEVGRRQTVSAREDSVMKTDSLPDIELDRLDRELSRAEHAQLLQWEAQDREDALPEIERESEPAMGAARGPLLERILRRCWNRLVGWR
jgi:hypothetical protein